MPRCRIIFAVLIIPFFLIGQDIDEAINCFNSFQFERARELFKEIVNDKNNPRIAEAYYYLGRLSVNPDSSLLLYNRVIRDYPQSRYADVSYLEAAKINIARENYKDAIVQLNELLEKFPETNIKDEVMFWLGVSYISNGQKDQGVEFLKALRTNYPQSMWSERAENIIPNGGVDNEYFTVQIGSYRNKTNAQIAADELKGKGLQAKVVEAMVKGNIYYRVWIGQFYTIEQAKAFSLILDSLGIKGNVVKGH